MRRRDLLLKSGAVVGAGTLTYLVLEPRSFVARYSTREVTGRSPIFDIEDDLPLERGTTASFLANSRSELAAQTKPNSRVLDDYDSRQGVEFATVVVVVLPKWSQILVDSMDVEDGTVSYRIQQLVEPEDEDAELAYHRMVQYWTRERPWPSEPTDVHIVTNE
ncbi:hypothetical protein [Haloarchaeobius sp. DYHT-AS-18]|uniref:hypothetical protein n=1 Tax=Haloarchaeobius sp. DYHT-AS-18 TaxID=3446117 RepID=UPI003EBD63FC